MCRPFLLQKKLENTSIVCGFNLWYSVEKEYQFANAKIK